MAGKQQDEGGDGNDCGAGHVAMETNKTSNKQWVVGSDTSTKQ